MTCGDIFFKRLAVLTELSSDCVQGLLEGNQLQQWGFTSGVQAPAVSTEFLYLMLDFY